MEERIGKYRVIRELGRGATSTVFLVEAPDRAEPVALKLVRFGGEEEAQWTRRLKKLFATEGAMAQKLDHPNIIKIHETFIDEEQAYIVMESIADKAICKLGAGEVVGEMAFLNQDLPRRCASVVTLTPLTWLEVNGSALALASDECRERFQKRLVSTAVRRLSEADHQLAGHGEPAHQPAALDKIEIELEPLDEVWKRG